MEETAGVGSTSSVRNFSPRLLRLLELLARADEPVKIDALSAALNTSRRTVFRELENVEEVLSPFHISLTSIPGKGLMFSGSSEDRQKIAQRACPPFPYPVSKQERLLRLLVELIASASEVQKLFYYANVLDVSESTVSNDLDELEPWLSVRGVGVVRKSGVGVQCVGTEESLRAALVSRFMTDGGSGGRSYSASFGFPGEDIETGVREILRRKKDVIDWMTSESFSLIAVYLMVMVDRLRKGKIIPNGCVSEQVSPGAFQHALAEYLVAETERQFSLRIPETEQQALSGWIQLCRSKQDSPLELGSADRQTCIQSLVMQMIDRFDPPIAAILKTNEQLTRLLSLHLEAALPRLRGGIALPNPLEAELIKNYPEEYEKTRRAVEALEEYIGLPVPSNEISFILIHFLAALAVLGERNIRRRVLRAGIICVAGIGASYMLAYQVRKRFKGELEVEVSGCDDKASWDDVDFLISTIPLTETDKPFVQVNTVLGPEDYQKIQTAIDAFAFTKRDVEQSARSVSLEKRLDSLIEIAKQSRLLLDNFVVESIKADCSFEDLVRFAADRFASENPEAARRALMSREAVVTQVVSELGIVLLHTRNAYSADPVFALIVPEGGEFTHAYFKHTKSCVFMLLPETSPHEVSELMGGISSALIDLPLFLEAVRAGDRETVRAVLEREISEILVRFRGEKLT
ncbi:MAG: PRD domain-containing protein [Treponema sp.]|jgi:mannitol operon transcriptional antiterminator|nr:PRD domain-containing protein [Treponema sp.]